MPPAPTCRPEQRTEGFTSGDTPKVPPMMTDGEVRKHCTAGGTECLEGDGLALTEGVPRKPAAAVRFV